MSLSVHSALLTFLVFGLSTPAAAPRTSVQRSLNDPTALAMFEDLITYDIETAGIAAKKAMNSDVREVAGQFVQDHKGLLKQAKDLAKKLNMTPTAPKEAPKTAPVEAKVVDDGGALEFTPSKK